MYHLRQGSRVVNRVCLGRSTFACNVNLASGQFSGFPGTSFKSSYSTSTLVSSQIVPFKLADIGEGIAEVELMKWFVKKGDAVKAFDRICEVQSDKATVEITSRYDGTILTVHHEEGNIVKVGSALVDIQLNDSGAPKLANNDPQPVLQSSSTPAVPLPSTFSRDAVIVGRDDHDGGKVFATPAVRRLAKENNVDLSQVTGSGPKGRVSKEDVLLFLQSGGARGAAAPRPISSASSSQHSASGARAAQQTTPPSSSSSSAKPTPAFIPPLAAQADKKVPIRGVQRMMVKSMTAALQVQHLTYSEELVVDKLIRLRKELKGEGERMGVKISFMPLIIKATSLALLDYPILNSTVSADVSEMTYHANHNIGIAMDTPKGLVVPVIKQVQLKSIMEIARELIDLQNAAMAGTLTEAQMSGGTFSLSNIGSIGGTYAVPVIVVPQVAIGAFGRQIVVPRYVGNDGNAASSDAIYSGNATVKPCTIMNVSWSADHRVIDGATVAKFSNTWKKYLENPSLMLAHSK